MKITLEKSILEPVMARAASIVDKRANVAIIQHVRLIAKKSSLEIRSTDLDIESIETIKCAIDETGDVTVPALMLYDITRNAKAGSQITLATSADDPRVSVTTGRSRFKLPVLPAGDFPEFKPQDPTTDAKVPASSFVAALAHTAFAMSTDAGRYNLCCVYLVGHDQALRAVATNGYVLALREFEQAGVEALSVLVPTKTAAEIRKRIDGAEGDITLTVSAGQVTVAYGGWTLRSKVIDGNFPEYQRVIPRDNPHTLTADADELRHAIRTAAMVANEKTRTVRFTLTPDALEVTAKGDAEAADAMEAQHDCPDMTMGFNADYLLQALDALDCDVLEVLVPEKPERPLIWRRQGDQTAFVVLVPTRV